MSAATTAIYTLSLHDALPISFGRVVAHRMGYPGRTELTRAEAAALVSRSEEHTSELQSRGHLVCRLLLEKKNSRILTACVYPKEPSQLSLNIFPYHNSCVLYL